MPARADSKVCGRPQQQPAQVRLQLNQNMHTYWNSVLLLPTARIFFRILGGVHSDRKDINFSLQAETSIYTPDTVG
ncbi:hypothetical protein SDJN03_04186, partial [Cucurbita argyrosperma subsp. sororia]